MQKPIYIDGRRLVPIQDTQSDAYEIAQLCERGAVFCRRVGGKWYVDEASLHEYRTRAQAETSAETQAPPQQESYAQAKRTAATGLGLNGPDGVWRHPGNANVRFAGFAAHDILGALQPRIAASTGSACTSGILEPSHVLQAIGLSEEEAESSIRFSIGRGTTDEDISEALNLIETALSRLADEGLAKTG